MADTNVPVRMYVVAKKTAPKKKKEKPPNEVSQGSSDPIDGVLEALTSKRHSSAKEQ